MRIVGGRFRGKHLKAPKGQSVRPTSDRTREAVFNILAHGDAALELEGLSVLDLCCGTGALGLEALSRGAAKACFIDQDAASLRLAQQNVHACGVGEQVSFLKLDAKRLPPPARIVAKPIDLVFMDPPYAQDIVLPAFLGLVSKGWIRTGTRFVIETGAEENLAPPRGFTMLDQRTYGAAMVHFLERSA